MKDIDSDFLTAVGTSHKVIALNNVTNNGGSVVLHDMFFLLSRNEVYGGLENNIDEGYPYQYYSDYSDLFAVGMDNDNNRIKYRNGVVQSWLLRSGSLSNGNVVRSLNTFGGIGGSNAYNNVGISPVCNIELDEEYKYNGQVMHIRDQVTVTKGNKALVFDVIGIDHDDVDFNTVTTSLFFPEQIKLVNDDAEFIDFREQKYYFADGTNADVILTTLPTFSGTNTLTIETKTQPSEMKLKGIIKIV